MNGLEALKIAEERRCGFKTPNSIRGWCYLDGMVDKKLKYSIEELLTHGWEVEPEKLKELWEVESYGNSDLVYVRICHSVEEVDAAKLELSRIFKITHYQEVSESGPCKPMSAVGDREGWLK